MKQTRLYIITTLCLQMVLGAILLSCSTENDEYKKDSPSAANPVEPIGASLEHFPLEQMPEKINQLIENQDIRKKFSDNSMVGTEKFNIDKTSEQWMELIEQI